MTHLNTSVCVYIYLSIYECVCAYATNASLLSTHNDHPYTYGLNSCYMNYMYLWVTRTWIHRLISSDTYEYTWMHMYSYATFSYAFICDVFIRMHTHSCATFSYVWDDAIICLMFPWHICGMHHTAEWCVQRVAVYRSVLHDVALCYCTKWRRKLVALILRCVAVCCSVLQCVVVCCSVWQCVAVCCSVLHIYIYMYIYIYLYIYMYIYIGIRWTHSIEWRKRLIALTLRFVVVCCSVLQCVTVRCSVV